MKKFFIYFFGLTFFSPFLMAQEKISVELIISCDSLPENSSIFITGNDPLIGNWQPDFAIMDEIEIGKWHKKLLLEKGQKLEFKITRGSWNNEALNDDASIPSNHTFEVSKDTTIEIKVNLWSDIVEGKIAGQITGIVKYHSNIDGAGLKPRSAIVWLPPFYFLETEKSYPVLYMHDGQNLFDPRTSTFKIDWQLDETADSLIRQNLIEEIIIVGVYNTADRSSEYSENDTGYAYMKFIVDSLKPFIDRNYRTLPGKEYTAVGGSSLGGLITFMMLWDYSDVFSLAACLSPALKVKGYDFVDNVKSYNDEKMNIKIYIDNGGDEIDSTLQPGIDEMLNSLKEKKYKQNEDIYWFKDENALHQESSWAKRAWRALIFMFGTNEGKKLLFRN